MLINDMILQDHVIRLFDLLTRHTQVQRDAKVPLVSIDANLCFVCLDVLYFKPSQVQRYTKEYLVMKDINLCFVCLFCIPNLFKSREDLRSTL